jgi:hypothetical protein
MWLSTIATRLCLANFTQAGLYWQRLYRKNTIQTLNTHSNYAGVDRAESDVTSLIDCPALAISL